MSKSWGRGSTTRWRKTRALVLARDNYSCQIKGPGCQARATHVDHIVPKVHGGSDDPSNLRASCEKCNLTRKISSDPSPKLDWLR